MLRKSNRDKEIPENKESREGWFVETSDIDINERENKRFLNKAVVGIIGLIIFAALIVLEGIYTHWQF